MKQHFFLILLTFFSLNAFGVKVTANQNPDKIVLSYELDSLYTLENLNHPGTFRFASEGFGILGRAEYPELLQRLESVQLPKGAIASGISVLAEIDTLKLLPTPGTEPHIEGTSRPETKPIKPYSGLWPAAQACLNPTDKYRGYSIGRISIFPLQYNYEKQELYVSRKMTVTINLSSAHVAYGMQSASDSEHRTKGILSHILTIPSSEDENEATIEPYGLKPFDYGEDAPLYLIISPEEFRSEAARFATAKRKLGYSIFSEFRSRQFLSNPDSTYSVIKNFYEERPNLEYVLLFGGGNIITPYKCRKEVYSAGEYYDYYTDYYFGCMDDSHIDDNGNPLSDLIIGRFPAQDLNEISAMVNKSVLYEINPPLNNANYFTTGVHFSEWNITTEGKIDPFIQSVEKLKECMENNNPRFLPETIVSRMYFTQKANYPIRYGDGTSVPYELQKPQYAWDTTPEDIIEKINEGCSYLLYRGHGNVGLLSHNFFANRHIASLSNKGNYPIVFAITCLAGTFYHPIVHPNGTHSICEDFLALPNKGAVAAIGANRESWSGFTDYLMAGLFDAMYPGILINYTLPKTTNKIYVQEENNELGKMLAIACERINRVSYSSDYGEMEAHGVMTREEFHCLGDPALKVFRKKPVQLTPVVIWQGDTALIKYDGRKLVAASKDARENGVARFPKLVGDYYVLPPYFKNFFIALIGDGYCPFIYNNLFMSKPPQANARIKSVKENGASYFIESENTMGEGFVVTLFNIYGTKIDSAPCIDGNAQLNKGNTMGIIILEKDGVKVDSQTIMPNR